MVRHQYSPAQASAVTGMTLSAVQERVTDCRIPHRPVRGPLPMKDPTLGFGTFDRGPFDEV